MIATRERNPERSRERILAAALHEFAAVGFAGARVASIAERAGLNKQLISHHFGGKRGLYRAVMNRRRRAGGAEMAVEPGAMPGALARFYERAATDPEWIRVLLWEALEADDVGADRVEGLEERAARYRDRIDWVRAEQAAGRLPAELDADLLLVSLLGAAIYPLLLPRVVELACGEDPAGEEFRRRYAEHLTALAGRLG
jgi:AcrR family transcriptional regulator